MAQLFTPLQLKNLHLKNRIVMPPMCTFMAPTIGIVTDWHSIHYGARAIGGVGLIIQEATAVEKRGRLSDHDLGIWSDDHVAGLASLVQTVQTLGGKIAIQLAHGGRKAWPGGEKVVGPSALAFSEHDVIPHELTPAEIETIIESFRLSARRAVKAGYDTIEIHGAHGYLIHEFLSPHANRRQDSYGGALENRLRFPLAVIRAVKEELPGDMPLFMRVSAIEYVEGGYALTDMLQMADAFCQAGVEVLHVSSGGDSPLPPNVWPGSQIPYAEALRQKLRIPVIAVGGITSGSMAEECVANGRADLVAVGRGLLADPHWPLTAARELGVRGIIPKPYEQGYPAALSQ